MGPKWSAPSFGARTSHGYNLAIFHPILTNKYTKMTNSLRRIEWNKKLSSTSLLEMLILGPVFAPRPQMGNVVPQNYPQIVSTCPGHHGQLISQNCVLKKVRGEPPLNIQSCLIMELMFSKVGLNKLKLKVKFRNILHMQKKNENTT